MFRHAACAVLLAIAMMSASVCAAAQGASASAIRAAIAMQETTWNKGDLDAFVTSYKNSPDILFISSKINKGYAAMVARYHAAYPTRESMGVLTFSDVEVQPLGPGFATATGKFHLKRTAAGGGDTGGSWMLVFEKTAQGWKVVRDVTMVAKP